MLAIKKQHLFGVAFLVILLSGCTTYYQKSEKFQQHFVKGEFEDANSVLDKNKKAATDKNQLLYFLQKGVILQLLKQYAESNDFFEKAYIYSEDFRKSFLKEATSILVNPMSKPYNGEDHELVLMHYFKTLNFLRLNQYDEALVECRRINNKLNLLNDRYEKKKNRYKRDAFAMNLMGITYEESGDINNAFIAYKNAWKAYEEDYKTHFGVQTPMQLKKDILRTAYLNGFTDELEKFETEFSMKYVHLEKPEAELLFLWHNGLGPVKDEWSLNFFIVKGSGGMFTFVNEEMGLSFPFPSTGTTAGGLGNLKFVRVAFPIYLERKPYYRSGELYFNGGQYKLETAQNINEIAIKTLEDRMKRELANSLFRLAVKQATQQQAVKQNENLGALLSVITAVSEKADTRNWQVIPYSIAYARIPIKAGSNAIRLKVYSPKKSRDTEIEFDFDCKKGQTLFYIHNNLESIPLEYQ